MASDPALRAPRLRNRERAVGGRGVRAAAMRETSRSPRGRAASRGCRRGPQDSPAVRRPLPPWGAPRGRPMAERQGQRLFSAGSSAYEGRPGPRPALSRLCPRSPGQSSTYEGAQQPFGERTDGCMSERTNERWADERTSLPWARHCVGLRMASHLMLRMGVHRKWEQGRRRDPEG